ncbi:MAG: transporter ATP-binding protein [Nocardioides sp.]|nr:transporter ATP-binding protein [Nocardioides sp.]
MLAVYLGAAVLAWVAGYLLNDVVQGTVRRMRDDVEDKVNALPLSYFDRQPRGELLSRVTNDIDNVSQTLQKTLSQLLTSVMTVLAVLSMMLWISPVLALVALVSVPISMIVTTLVMKRSQGLFVQQWRQTGRLNAHIEETFSGHALVEVYGRQGEAERVFAEENDALSKASFGAQFVSGLIMPIMMFVGNLNYVVIAVLGRLRVASASMPRAALRSQIGMVLQDTWLFAGTIRDNIAYGRPEASEAEIQEAARATFVDRFVHSLPAGYDTVIDEDGANLSAGERQLITIARAFLAAPDLLILDEATSSVDTRTELLLQHAMAALRTDRTSFVIAHRLSTIRDAHLILVMEDGAIVEQGDRESLLRCEGAYARLYRYQFASATA